MKVKISILKCEWLSFFLWQWTYLVESPPPMSMVLSFLWQVDSISLTNAMTILAAETKSSRGFPWLPTWKWTPFNHSYFLKRSKILSLQDLTRRYLSKSYLLSFRNHKYEASLWYLFKGWNIFVTSIFLLTFLSISCHLTKYSFFLSVPKYNWFWIQSSSSLAL